MMGTRRPMRAGAWAALAALALSQGAFAEVDDAGFPEWDLLDAVRSALVGEDNGTSEYFVGDPALTVVSGPCENDGAFYGAPCVKSANYPSNYSNSEHCEIQVAEGNLLKLEAVAFDTEAGFDKLQVNGDDYSGASGPSCMVPHGSITWTSDGSNVRAGWRICLVTPSAFAVASGHCTNVQASDGLPCVTSPNYPSLYDNDDQCMIHVPACNIRRLTTDAFETESNHDHLTVNGLDYSGQDGPTGIVPQGSITWTTDHTIINTGWRICLQVPPLAVASGPCVDELDSDGAPCVTSPNYPLDYGINEHCEIQVAEGNTRPLKVDAFATEADHDKLQVNGDDYSGGWPGPKGVVPHGSITWTSDGGSVGLGWRICLRVPALAVDSGNCVEDEDSDGAPCVTSPHYPSAYGNNERCTIRVAEDRTGALNVEAFETEGSNDVLQINGVSYSNTSMPPSGVVPHGNITWRTDSSIVYSGWRLCLPAPPKPPDGGGSGSAGIVVAVVGIVLVLLAVAGFFGYRWYRSKDDAGLPITGASRESSLSPTNTAPPSMQAAPTHGAQPGDPLLHGTPPPPPPVVYLTPPEREERRRDADQPGPLPQGALGVPGADGPRVDGSFASNSGAEEVRRAALARMADAGEDGRVRSPIAGLFRNAVLTTISVALGPLLPTDQRELVLKTTAVVAEQTQGQFPDLASDMIQAIVAYTMELIPEEASVYWMCNAALRDQNRAAVQDWVNFIYLLLTALSRLPPVPNTTVVYRGYKKAHTELGKQFVKGGTVVFSGFTSAATSIEVMQHFVGEDGPRTLVSLHLRSAPRSIVEFSLYPQEAEVVLPPGAIFKITGVFNAGKGLMMMDLHQQEYIDELLRFD